jgi:hypothetical protein
VNLYPIIEDEGALSPETLRATPGVTLILADPDVPLFDPLGPPDEDSPADPDGPTPPDPDAWPEEPDAPLPDKDEDGGEDPDGDRPTYPPEIYPECAPYDCEALASSFPLPSRSGLTVSANDPALWAEWFPIPGFDLYASGTPALSDFQTGVESELLPESSRSDPVIDPCAGPLLSVLRLRTGSRIEYTPEAPSITSAFWSLKGGTTANDYPNTVGSANVRILDPTDTPRGNASTINIDIVEVGSTPLTQFSINLTASRMREAGTSDSTVGGVDLTFGPYTTNPIGTENLDSWILSGFDLLADIDDLIEPSPPFGPIFIPVQIRIYLAWNGGEETATITQNLEWEFGTSATGIIDKVDWNTIRVANNNVRVAAFGSTGTEPLTPTDFAALVLGWRRSREDYTPPGYC